MELNRIVLTQQLVSFLSTLYQLLLYTLTLASAAQVFFKATVAAFKLDCNKEATSGQEA
jgi:hypothetical protein